DNGKGMTSETMQNVTDPFYTTRKTRKVGLGIPFFKMAAEQTDGKFSLDSTLGVGTTVTASFTLGHVDLVPLGDMSGSICTLIQCNPSLDFVYIVKADDEQFTLDTRELRQILGTDVSFDNAEVALFIKDYLAENTNHIIQRSVT
ncbi:MAG: sensor histidine kinase, partial [Oscillospiraceae bacterium]